MPRREDMYQGRYVVHLSPEIIEHLFDGISLGSASQHREVFVEDDWEPEDTQIEMRKDVQGDYIPYALTHLH
jgi:hypothetical protein